MSEVKRVGSYIHPADGVEDWFEPSTIGMVVLNAKMITKIGDTNATAIDFKLGYLPEKNAVSLIAEYTVGNNKYTSNVVKMDEVEFGNQITQKVYEDKPIDEAQIIVDAKNKCVENLTIKLMDDSILTGGMRFPGFGLIIVDGDNTLTFEALDIDYKVERGQGIKTVNIYQSVGQASLSNLESPEISLWTGTHKVSLIKPEVQTAIEGKIKQYTLLVEDIIIALDSSMPEHTVYENPDFENEGFVEAFIADRKTLLNDTIIHDKDLDNRFGGLFD
jgi:hypothetical protein